MPARHRGAHRRQLQVDDVAELILGEERDAHRDAVARDAGPFVILGVAKRVGIAGHAFPVSEMADGLAAGKVEPGRAEIVRAHDLIFSTNGVFTTCAGTRLWRTSISKPLPSFERLTGT